MTVGRAANPKIKAKTLQGQTIETTYTKEWKVFELKKVLAKKMNDMAESQSDSDSDYQKIHPQQLRLTKNEVDLDDDQVVGEVDSIEDDFVYVFVGDASKVPINVRVHVFKGTGVDATRIEVNLGDTADTVKDKLIAASFGPQDKSYTLFFKGRPLLDKQPIMNYGVEDGSEILVGVIM